MVRIIIRNGYAIADGQLLKPAARAVKAFQPGNALLNRCTGLHGGGNRRKGIGHIMHPRHVEPDMADHFSLAKEIIFRKSTAVHLEIGRAVIVTAAKPESNHLFLSQQIRNRLTGIDVYKRQYLQ